MTLQTLQYLKAIQRRLFGGGQ